MPWLKSLSQYLYRRPVNHSLAELKELTWLMLFDEGVRATSSARRRAVLMAHASESNSIWSVIVPADGTRAATV